jgi:hypothetical protein
VIRLLLAEILKQGKRPIHRRLLVALPVFFLLAALLFVVLRVFGVGAELPGGPGTGLAFAANNLFPFFGVIFAVATASSIGSSEYDFATAFPVILLGLLAATWARNLLGGLFAALVYSFFDLVVSGLARLPEAAVPGWLDLILRASRAVAPWLPSGLGEALAGGPGAWPPGLAVALLIVYVVGLTGLLALLLERRDVT